MLRVLPLLAVACAISACSDPQTSQPFSDLECEVLTGDDPWITLHTEQSSGTWCVEMAESQNAIVFNKGFQSVDIDWPGRSKPLASDDSFDTGPIGKTLAVGEHRIQSAPFPMPMIRVIED